MPAELTLRNGDKLTAAAQYTTIHKHVVNAGGEDGAGFVQVERDNEPRVTLNVKEIVRIDEIKG